MLSVGTIVGNYAFSPTSLNTQFTGRWSDPRTLIFQPSLSIPLGTTITWTLNPTNASTPIKSASGQTLATVTGSYKIAPNSGGSPTETCANPAAATYVFTKLLQYSQPGADIVVPLSANAGLLSISVVSPAPGPALTAGSITLPDATVKTLNNQAGAFRRTDTFTNETSIEAAYPPGNYTLRFTRTGEAEHVVAMTLPASPTVVPKVENYIEAQAIDPTKDFTVRWNSFSPQGAGALVRLVITDEFANRIFLAPNMCVPRTLDSMATSVTIPANYLRPGFTYNAQLIFGLNFYSSTTDVPQMSGNGFVQRILAFTIRASAGATGPAGEQCTIGQNTAIGSYGISKYFSHQQISAQEVIPQTNAPAIFNATIGSPPGGPAVTNGSLTLPSSAVQTLTNQFGFFNISRQFQSETALNGEYPSGQYTIRFNQTGQAERVIGMEMPATTPTIPRIVNFDGAQSIDPAQEFTLQWDAFSPVPAGAFIQLTITDEIGNLIFIAPNLCIPRPLEPTDTSIVIPTNYFRAGVAYLGHLTFGFTFYSSNMEVPQMAGYGVIQRSTAFPLKAKSEGTVIPPARANFTTFRRLSNGHPEFNLSGTAGKNYRIERTSNLSTRIWASLGTLTMSAGGTAVFEDTNATLPAFYRAVGE